MNEWLKTMTGKLQNFWKNGSVIKKVILVGAAAAVVAAVLVAARVSSPPPPARIPLQMKYRAVRYLTAFLKKM